MTERATNASRTRQSGSTSSTSRPKEQTKASIDDISAGREIAIREKGPDELSQIEALTLEKEMWRARINDITSRTTMREGYEKKVYRFLIGYSVVAAVMLFLCGFELMKLPESVLVAIAGSTAVAAIGLVAQIGKGLFGQNGEAEPQLP